MFWKSFYAFTCGLVLFSHLAWNSPKGENAGSPFTAFVTGFIVQVALSTVVEGLASAAVPDV